MEQDWSVGSLHAIVIQCIRRPAKDSSTSSCNTQRWCSHRSSFSAAGGEGVATCRGRQEKRNPPVLKLKCIMSLPLVRSEVSNQFRSMSKGFQVSMEKALEKQDRQMSQSFLELKQLIRMNNQPNPAKKAKAAHPHHVEDIEVDEDGDKHGDHWLSVMVQNMVDIGLKVIILCMFNAIAVGLPHQSLEKMKFSTQLFAKYPWSFFLGDAIEVSYPSNTVVKWKQHVEIFPRCDHDKLWLWLASCCVRRNSEYCIIRSPLPYARGSNWRSCKSRTSEEQKCGNPNCCV